jgi:hypothetical protein
MEGALSRCREINFVILSQSTNRRWQGFETFHSEHESEKHYKTRGKAAILPERHWTALVASETM